jgi:hypothetical protein
MRNADDTPTCDRSDGKLTKANTPGGTDRQRRFLDAYQQGPTISTAARLAGINRATVYRWLADPDFAAAMSAAAEEFFRAHAAKVRAEETARRHWREEREGERLPMRCHYLALARAKKRR